MTIRTTTKAFVLLGKYSIKQRHCVLSKTKFLEKLKGHLDQGIIIRFSLTMYKI